MKSGNLRDPMVALMLACAGGCATAPPPRVVEPPRAPPKPAGHDPEVLSKLALPVKAGAVVEMKRATAIYLEGTRTMVTLLETKWDEMAVEDQKPKREGKAKLLVSYGKEERTLLIAEGEEKIAFELVIAVDYAFETYDAPKGRYVPHAKLRLEKAR